MENFFANFDSVNIAIGLVSILFLSIGAFLLIKDSLAIKYIKLNDVFEDIKEELRKIIQLFNMQSNNEEESNLKKLNFGYIFIIYLLFNVLFANIIGITISSISDRWIERKNYHLELYYFWFEDRDVNRQLKWNGFEKVFKVEKKFEMLTKDEIYYINQLYYLSKHRILENDIFNDYLNERDNILTILSSMSFISFILVCIGLFNLWIIYLRRAYRMAISGNNVYLIILNSLIFLIIIGVFSLPISRSCPECSFIVDYSESIASLSKIVYVLTPVTISAFFYLKLLYNKDQVVYSILPSLFVIFISGLLYTTFSSAWRNEKQTYTNKVFGLYKYLDESIKTSEKEKLNQFIDEIEGQ